MEAQITFQERYEHDNIFQEIIQGLIFNEDKDLTLLIEMYLKFGIDNILEAVTFCGERFHENCHVEYIITAPDSIENGQIDVIDSVAILLHDIYNSLFGVYDLDDVCSLCRQEGHLFTKVLRILQDLRVHFHYNEGGLNIVQEYYLLPITVVMLIFPEEVCKEFCHLYIEMLNMEFVPEIPEMDRFNNDIGFIDYPELDENTVTFEIEDIVRDRNYSQELIDLIQMVRHSYLHLRLIDNL